MERVYRSLLKTALRRSGRIFAAAILAGAGGTALLLCRPAAFVSPGAATEIEAAALFPPGTRLEAMVPPGLRLAGALAELPEIAAVFGRAGAEDEDAGRRADPDYRRERLLFRCILRNGAEGGGALEKIRLKLAEFAEPGLDLSAAYPQDRTERLLGLSASHTLAVRGNGREELSERLRRVRGELGAAAGLSLAELQVRPSGTRPELRIIPRREPAALLGVSSLGMAETLYAATEGMTVGRLETGGRPLDIRLAGTAVPGLFSLETIPLSAGSGGPVFVSALGRVERHEAEAALARLDRSDVIYLDALAAPGEEAALRKTLGALAETTAELSRADESVFSRYRSSLVLTVLLVLMLLYMTMAAQFESFSLPLLLMLTIPFSLAGAGPALFLSGTGLDSGSVLALVVLFGLVVNNGIVLYEISGEKFSSGASALKAVYTGAHERLRPILITTLTTMFALLPLALSPLGASQRSMAAAMLGGVVASALLSLFALPPVFVRFLGKGRNRGGVYAG